METLCFRGFWPRGTWNGLKMKLFMFYEKINLWNFKACVHCFLSNLYFSTFHCRDILIFIFLSSPLFFPVSHCLRGWSKKNYKIYDIIHCLNKNLIAHFVWYIEKEIKCDIETLSMDRELNKKHFCGNIMQKICTKS